MASVEAVVYGASNALGRTDTYRFTDYSVSALAAATYDKPPFVTKTKKQIIVDLSQNPGVSENTNVVQNSSDHGNSAMEMAQNLEHAVLDYAPKHLFLWSGLTDPVLAISVMHGGKISPGKEPVADILREIMAEKDNLDDKLRVSADFIAGKLKWILDTASNNGISTMVGTIPPFAMTLLDKAESTKSPMGRHLFHEGVRLGKMVNERIRAFENTCVIDAYNLVVDKENTFMRRRMSYGISGTPTARDIVHINTFGQIKVAEVFCQNLHGKSVRIKPPQKGKLVFG